MSERGEGVHVIGKGTGSVTIRSVNASPNIICIIKVNVKISDY